MGSHAASALHQCRPIASIRIRKNFLRSRISCRVDSKRTKQLTKKESKRPAMA